MRDENNFIFSYKLLIDDMESLRLLRALAEKRIRSYSICGKIYFLSTWTFQNEPLL